MQQELRPIDANTLREALKLPLPGPLAQQKMLPKGRDMVVASDVKNYLRSAVMLLFYPENGELYLCLTKRNEGLKHHPGQISFPGGRCEQHENDGWLTALRETEEEIGVKKEQIEYLGRLSDVYITVSRFNIHPFAGLLHQKPEFIINHHEVDALITLPLSELFKAENMSSRTFQTYAGPIEAPCYCVQGHVIWGATSMMLAELEAILRLHCSRRATH